MHLVSCTEERHAQAILDIFNDAIANSTALYEYHPRTHETMTNWFAAKRAGGYPVLGYEDGAGTLLGFASYGAFRGYPANKYAVEHSVYVRADQRGKGLGRALLEQVVVAAGQAGLHTIVGGIDADNRASIALHEQLGFVHAGTVRHAAFKFGRWLDLAFYQLILPTPAAPVDG
ncbi:acetyltransferase [Duganella sp. Leaf126]|uniref:GNAT family N-acetyltransferase n=1 Tax=Duganella sp. Leaf126 TaxID=1736266 RepID=UPI0006FE13DE|nr:GNAT family N-acetyltransferase [Duganella sp. Leaf126]KQQ45113.1 acetyltransferase [Duganella sp. Leaf126]